MKSNKGFTLIELMVVIVIAGILAAIALPSFLNFTERVHHTEARLGISYIIRTQRTYSLEHNKWDTTMQVVGTENYSFRIQPFRNRGRSGLSAIAVPRPRLNRFMAKIWVEDGQLRQSNICRARYGRRNNFMGNRLQCR